MPLIDNSEGDPIMSANRKYVSSLVMHIDAAGKYGRICSIQEVDVARLSDLDAAGERIVMLAEVLEHHDLTETEFLGQFAYAESR